MNDALMGKLQQVNKLWREFRQVSAFQGWNVKMSLMAHSHIQLRLTNLAVTCEAEHTEELWPKELKSVISSSNWSLSVQLLVTTPKLQLICCHHAFKSWSSSSSNISSTSLWLHTAPWRRREESLVHSRSFTHTQSGVQLCVSLL